MHILSIDGNKSRLQISGKVAGGVCLRELSKLFRAPIYWAHRAVVFAIARLSCYEYDNCLCLYGCQVSFRRRARTCFPSTGRKCVTN